MVATTASMIFTLVPALLYSGMPTLRLIPNWQRRHFTTVWIGHVVAMAVILLATIVSLPANNWNGILIVYSYWAATAALSFLAHATEAGMYYIMAAVLFLAAIVMALTPEWAPLEVACLMSANMTAQAIYLRGRTKERPLGTGATLASASTLAQEPGFTLPRGKS